MADIKAKKVLFKNRNGESLIPYIGEDYVKQEDMVEINLGLTLTLFDTILKDHILTYQESQGLALQGTYVYKEALAGSRYGYPDFYAKCLEEFKQATTTETVNGVTVKVHSNGHKFYDIADKNSIDLFYNATGTAWFYGIDAVGERIFLPRDNYFAVKGVAPTVGTGRALGVTNNGSTVFPLKAVQTTSGSWDTMPNLNVVTNDGVSASSTLPALNGRSGVQDIGGNWENSPSGYYGVSTDPQSSGLETHLQPKENKYLYICVGNTTNYEGIADVVNQGMEILDQINAGFVPKDSMQEVPCIVETYVNGTSWYRIWSDGWCEQGGYYSNQSTITVTLLKPYIDTNYNVLFAGAGNVLTKTTNSFNFDPSHGYATKSAGDWKACGYIA